jgi:hypothetical protein
MPSHPFAVLVPSLLAFAFAGASAADRAVAVTVTNVATAPVPVLVTNPQGGATPAPKSVATDLFANVTSNVMAPPGPGKRFVVKHLAVFLTSNSSGTLLADANCQLILHQGSISTTLELFALQHADLIGGIGLSVDDYLVLGPADALDMACLSNPANSSGRVTVSGDLLSGQ